MWHIVAFLNGLLSRLAGITCISTEMLLWGFLGLRTFRHDLIQCRFQEFHVMHLGPAGDYRQRDSIPVDEQTALAPFFFPDLWGSDRQFLVPRAP